MTRQHLGLTFYTQDDLVIPLEFWTSLVRYNFILTQLCHHTPRHEYVHWFSFNSLIRQGIARLSEFWVWQAYGRNRNFRVWQAYGGNRNFWVSFEYGKPSGETETEPMNKIKDKTGYLITYYLNKIGPTWVAGYRMWIQYN